jgi:XTP/dITP diphosphohydrolase
MARLVLASHNAGKLAELRALLAASGIEVVPQSQFGIGEIDETGPSFAENALLKARHASRISRLPALADDSGLCVDALGGAPGLHSARYAGADGDPQANILTLLDALAEIPDAHRGAHFHCTLALLRHPEDPAPLLCEGRWRGRILHAPQGEDGFGYDPVFFDEASGQSAAELTREEKAAVSHRGQALRQLMAALAREPL